MTVVSFFTTVYTYKGSRAHIQDKIDYVNEQIYLNENPPPEPQEPRERDDDDFDAWDIVFIKVCPYLITCDDIKCQSYCTV